MDKKGKIFGKSDNTEKVNPGNYQEKCTSF